MAGRALVQRCLLRCLFYHRLFFVLDLLLCGMEWNTHRLGMRIIRKVGTERVSVFSQQDDTPFFFIEVMELDWDTYRDERSIEYKFYSILWFYGVPPTGRYHFLLRFMAPEWNTERRRYVDIILFYTSIVVVMWP